MINIKRLLKLCLVSVFFFSVNLIAQEQEINQVDADGERTGIWRKYYPNNRIRYEGEFRNGKEIGTFKYYDIFSSNHPVAIKKFSPSSNEAFVKFYTLKGKLRSEGKMIGKRRIGKWKYYFLTGKIFSEEFYVNGRLTGIVKNYYGNGKLAEETQYEEGLKNGVSKEFADDGVLLQKVYFVDGELNGDAKYYDLKGNLKEEGVYKRGKRFGKWKFYLNGELVDGKRKKLKRRF